MNSQNNWTLTEDKNQVNSRGKVSGRLHIQALVWIGVRQPQMRRRRWCSSMLEWSVSKYTWNRSWRKYWSHGPFLTLGTSHGAFRKARILQTSRMLSTNGVADFIAHEEWPSCSPDLNPLDLLLVSSKAQDLSYKIQLGFARLSALAVSCTHTIIRQWLLRNNGGHKDNNSSSNFQHADMQTVNCLGSGTAANGVPKLHSFQVVEPHSRSERWSQTTPKPIKIFAATSLILSCRIHCCYILFCLSAYHLDMGGFRKYSRLRVAISNRYLLCKKPTMGMGLQTHSSAKWLTNTSHAAHAK